MYIKTVFVQKVRRRYIMNLNLYIISDYINQKVLHSFIKDNLIDCPLAGVTLYNSDSAPLDGWLYLITASDWKKDSVLFTSGQFVIWDWDRDCEDNNKVSCIGIDKEKTIYQLFFSIQKIFERFQQWEVQLYQHLTQHHTLREFGSSAQEFLENPISMYTAGLRNIFFCERHYPGKQMLFNEKDIEAYLPYEDIEALRLDKEFIKTVDAQEPQIFPDEFWGYRILYDNIRINGIYVARVMACEIERPIRNSDYAILRKLAEFLKVGIEQQETLINNHPKDFDSTIHQLIDGKPPAPELLDTVLKALDWKETDTYFCILIPISIHDKAIHTVHTFCTRLESQIAGSVSLIIKDYFMVLVNMRHAIQTRTEILSNLAYLLREGLLKAGISTEFSNLHQLIHYYNQAKTALSIGYETDPTIWYYRYEKYAYRHLLRCAAGDLPVEALCPEGLLRLIQYDYKHKREYTRSLKVYLENNMSITQTIRILYMQRSTFIYQLKRIQEISGMELKDKKTRIHLLLVFQIIDEKNTDILELLNEFSNSPSLPS